MHSLTLFITLSAVKTVPSVPSSLKPSTHLNLQAVSWGFSLSASSLFHFVPSQNEETAWNNDLLWGNYYSLIRRRKRHEEWISRVCSRSVQTCWGEPCWIQPFSQWNSNYFTLFIYGSRIDSKLWVSVGNSLESEAFEFIRESGLTRRAEGFEGEIFSEEEVRFEWWRRRYAEGLAVHRRRDAYWMIRAKLEWSQWAILLWIRNIRWSMTKSREIEKKNLKIWIWDRWTHINWTKRSTLIPFLS